MQNIIIEGFVDNFPKVELMDMNGSYDYHMEFMLVEKDLCLPCIAFGSQVLKLISCIEKGDKIRVSGRLFQKYILNDVFSFDIVTYLFVNSFWFVSKRTELTFIFNDNFANIDFKSAYSADRYIKGRILSLERSINNAKR